MPAPSPLCEFGFRAACARSAENAASAEKLEMQRDGETSHSCIAAVLAFQRQTGDGAWVSLTNSLCQKIKNHANA